MIRRIIIAGIGLAWLAVLIAGCSGGNNKSGLPDMRETYRKDDKIPFGGYVAHQVVRQLFPEAVYEERREPIAKTWAGIYDTAAFYVSISRNLYTSEADVDAIMSYVRSGNDMLLVASKFDENLLERVECSAAGGFEFFNVGLNNNMSVTSVSLQPGHYPSTDSFSYYYRPFVNRFTNLPKGKSVVLSYNNTAQPNCFVYFYGKGKLILHCDPRAFSNYFLLQRKNYTYLQQLLGISRVKPQQLYWNNYYVNINRSRSKGKDKDDDSSTLSGLTGTLRTAFWLALLLLVLYLLNGLKRRQRIIESRNPNENTSVTFTETIGLLYLQKKDNKNIAEKMCTYFNEFVRNQYFLNTNQVNQEFISTLSRKSGVPQQTVETLYRAMAHAQQSAAVDDYQLLSLNEQIQNFYKYKI